MPNKNKDIQRDIEINDPLIHYYCDLCDTYSNDTITIRPTLKEDQHYSAGFKIICRECIKAIQELI